MANKIKLENPLQPVHLTLATGPTIITGDGPDKNYVNAYVHEQSNTAMTWQVNHNLGKYCSVTVVDSNDDVVIGEIHYNSLNQVTLSFTASFSGKAFCN